MIAHDLTATLGWDARRAQAEARDALGNVASWLPTTQRWEALGPTTQRDVLYDVVVKAVEDLQQYLHDTFVDTSWPPCPRHPNHPLWLEESEDGAIVWQCAQDQVVVAPLGKLPGADGGH